MKIKIIEEKTIKYFEDKLDKYGNSYQAVDWWSKETQDLRFEVIRSLLLPLEEPLKVHEIGCGLGHFVSSIKEPNQIKYSGSDISSKMIQASRQIYPNVNFFKGNIVTDDYKKYKFDYLFESGIFNLKMGFSYKEWHDYVLSVLTAMYEAATVGIVFNMITDYVRYKRRHLFYAGSLEMFDFCKRKMSRFVTLRHNYPLYEFTIAVYKEKIMKQKYPLGDWRV
jgi:SAM-dependent methyltransferase